MTDPKKRPLPPSEPYFAPPFDPKSVDTGEAKWGVPGGPEPGADAHRLADEAGLGSLGSSIEVGEHEAREEAIAGALEEEGVDNAQQIRALWWAFRILMLIELLHLAYTVAHGMGHG